MWNELRMKYEESGPGPAVAPEKPNPKTRTQKNRKGISFTVLSLFYILLQPLQHP